MSENKYYYVEVEEKEVDPEKTKLAQRIIDYCNEKFEARKPRVRWFKWTTEADFRVLLSQVKIAAIAGIKTPVLPHFGQTDDPCLGFYAYEDCPDSIFLRTDLSRERLKGALVHELHHFIAGSRAADPGYESLADQFEDIALFEINRVF
jgi:hypothetical protein